MSKQFSVHANRLASFTHLAQQRKRNQEEEKEQEKKNVVSKSTAAKEVTLKQHN